MTATDTSQPTVLLTGATGYVGGRLAPLLVARGHRVRVLVRNPARLADLGWAEDVEVFVGDLSDPDSLAGVCDGIDVVYYLVHSMGDDKKFRELELRCANNLVEQARTSGVQRLIYLSGLQDPDRHSDHMASREGVGRVFLESGLLSIVFQAGIVVGSGSISFEMIRHLTDRLPVMVTPKFVRNKVTPIAIGDALHYLVQAATAEFPISRTWDIGGEEDLTYGGMMNTYAEVAGLRRRIMIPLPVFTPALASRWVGVVTPVPGATAKPLIKSLSVDAVVTERDIDEVIARPEGGLTSYREAIALALDEVELDQVETRFTDDYADTDYAPARPLPGDPDWAGKKYFVDTRIRTTTASKEQLFEVIESIGGANGWYSVPLLWKIRGWIDVLATGPGLIRGRRSPTNLRVGDCLDWWTVEKIDRPRTLLLRADMRVSGDAWLEFKVLDRDDNGTGCRYRHRAIFFPHGLAGLVYWWSIYPAHGFVFPAMADNILAEAEKRAAAAGDPTDG
ncbi:SDR family oxidoreductase [Corynebacterium mendelii]|uniref:SDR family oxidoreductase n=1 Tax=Corynebacterium mendelii TaxID=2765362 RepID=A0A939E1B3_9CORY|nr:SDR family oxidoreductase [Corynebacterium mendelii]MBN9644878.1 SDR family oxidoreductase [Corynebacterium mendelii]